MEKITFKNRKGQSIVGVLEKPTGEIKGTCVVQHGYSGFKEQDHIQIMKDAFLENGFVTFNFDTTNSFNESDGEFMDATLGLHYEDLEDVVKWTQEQEWFVKPLALIGHSMGGYAVARYAEEYPEEVSFLAPVAPVVSGELSFEAHERFEPGDLEKWKEVGFKEKISSSRPGIEKRMNWESMEERLDHDLLVKAEKLTMPTLLIVGSEDISCPPDHVEKLFDAIPEGVKTFEVIKGAPHTYHTSNDLIEVKNRITSWLQRVV